MFILARRREYMFIDQLKVFRDLADAGSLAKAAALRGTSERALHGQMRALEARLSVTLFEEGSRELALTPQGQAVLQAGNRMLEIYDALTYRLQALRTVVGGELRIATIYSIGLHELPPRLKAFRERHPEVEVQVAFRRSAQVYQQVLEGDSDLGFVAYPMEQAGLEVTIFEEDEMVLICPPAHPLAAEREVDLARLSGEKFVSFEPDQPTRKVIDKLLRERCVEIAHSIEFDNIEALKRAVEIEAGISIVPRNTVRQEVANGSLVSIPIAGAPLRRPLGVITRPQQACSAAHQEFLHFLSRTSGS